MHTATENEAAISDLVGNLRFMVRAIYVDSAKMSRQYGLTSAQSSVVRTLFKNGSMSSADLSRTLHVTPSNITGIIDRLGKKGLAERIPQSNDRRVVRIQLTAQGRALGEVLPDPIEKKLIRSLSHLPPEQVNLLGNLIRHLLQAIDAEVTDDIGMPDFSAEAAPPADV